MMASSERGPEADRLPRIAVTTGDPAGIGPEVALKAARCGELRALCTPILIGNAVHLASQARACGLDPDFRIIAPGAVLPAETTATLVYDLNDLAEEIEMGRAQAAAGRAAARYIEAAVALCQSSAVEAMATAPINKEALALSGCPYPGHTEYLAALTRTDDYAMALIAPALRVALLTTHIPLARVPAEVRREPLARLIRLVDRELARYLHARPRIAVAALNPHAGEGGLFGDEEAREMAPAIAECRAAGIEVSGPHSGDTIFARAARGEFEIVISCYHDQGLIPVKCLSFGEAVNVTLGLPFIRTSVDHGTAFDIAGRNAANPSSMIAAIKLAADFALRRRNS